MAERSLSPKLLGALLTLLTLHQIGAQNTVLNLFSNGGDEAVLFVPVGSGEPFELRMATNLRTEQLVTGDVMGIEVQLNGGTDDTNVETIEIDEDTVGLPIRINIEGQIYRYVLGGMPSAANYSALLSTLTYVSNLTSEALNDPPRNITISAVGSNFTQVTAVANIMLIPANLEDPVFASDPIEVDLEENTGNGGLVTTVVATDPEGRQVTYEFMEPSSVFSISSAGEVRVLNSTVLDYEDENNRVFRLTVVATDTDPISPRSSDATLVISLTNANDNPPVFTEATYTFSVVEEATGAVVGTIAAMDADGDLNSLRYDFSDASTGISFNLNGGTGEISVRSALDFEDRTSHSFQVQVSDSLFTAFAQVEVEVMDIADNRPVTAPAEKTIIVDLDFGDNQISLNEGTGGPLVVSDDSPALVSGYADITVLRNGVEETFPNQYGICECTNPACQDVFTLCGTSFSLQQDLFAGATPASSAGPTLVSGLGFQVYSFNGRNDLSNNWLEISSAAKTLFLETTDDFTISLWIRVASGSGSSYIVTFELSRARYFSLYESSSSSLVLYYFRDNLPGVSSDNDDGRDTQVALTFFYDPAIFPNGLRDNQWHFVTFTIDYPAAILTVDGYEYRPTRGNFFNQFESQVFFSQLTDGTFYDMPAPIITKTQAQIDAISGKIGGTARGNGFSLDGEMRQLTLTNIFGTSTLNCIASCNNRIGVASGATIPSSITTLYNPATRRFSFRGAASPSQYTILLQSLVYFSNGFLLPQEQGESRIIRISVQDEVDFGNIAQISVIGRSNQRDPVFDANGDIVDGVDFQTNFREGDVTQVSILSPQAFITDNDIESRVEWVAVTIVNPLLVVDQEWLSLVDRPPSVLNVNGANSFSINFTAADPLRASPNVFITALLSVRYNNIADEPQGVDRVIRFTVSDGLRTGTAITTVMIETIDDVPSLDLNGAMAGVSTTAEFRESGAPVTLAPSLLLSDPDSPNIVEATARIERVFDMGNESIAFDAALLPSGVTCVPASCNGTDIRITGAGFQFNYQTLLRSLRYVNLQQSVDLPNLRDRVVFVTVSDGVSNSDLTANVRIDFIPVNPRIILELAAPLQNYSTEFVEDQQNPIDCYSLVRVVDTSITTLQSIVVSIQDTLPDGIIESDEILVSSSLVGQDISVEINTALKRITFSQVASVNQYIAAVQRIQYFNPEDEPYPVNRLVEFLVIPGGGAPNDRAYCNITIINNNDNPPVCDPSEVVADVAENASTNTLIVTLEATDIDVGPDGEIVYSMVSGDSTLFSVASTGDIFLLGNLDREAVDKYMLQVDACDTGTPQLCCQFNVTIQVTDINDNPPAFELPLYNLTVAENRVVDLTTFIIEDIDIGMNAEVLLLEIDDNSFSPRTACMGRFVTSTSPVPTLSTTLPNGLDFEQSDLCIFSLIISDTGAPTLTGTTVIQVAVTNVDDNPPMFSMASYTFNVEEENVAPLIIGSVTATDDDSTAVTYSLTGTTMFMIDSVSGNVSILFSGDYDVATAYQFTVIARDPASNTATVPVTVNIIAINNDPPVLDLNATALDSNNAEIPILFVEGGDPVVIETDPVIEDPDEVTLTITRIRVEVANSGSPSNEILSVSDQISSSDYILLPSTPGVLMIEPVAPADILSVYSLLAYIQYQNTEDEISACRADLYPCRFGSSSRTLLYTVFDGMFFSNRSEAYITFEFVNDAPFVDLDNAAAGIGFSTVFQEGAGPVRIASADGFTLLDADDDNLESLSCVLTNPLDGDDEFLVLNGSLPAGITLSATNHSLQFTGVSSVENYRTALSLVVYNSVTLNPNTAARLVEVSASDGELMSETAVTTIVLEIENQIPRLDLAALELGINFTTAFVEQGAPAVLSDRPILLDEDDINMLRLVVTVVDGSGTEEVLALDSSLITSPLTYTFSYPILTVSGIADILVYTSIIRSITYNNTAVEIGDTSDRLVEFVVTDEKGGDSVPVFTYVNIVPVDDNAPMFLPTNVYNFTVDENSQNLTLVGTLEVQDADLPPGTDVPAFTIVSASPNYGTSDFFIRNNPLSPFQAQIMVIGAIDFDDRAESYTLRVEATSGAFTSTATVYIAIENLPDIAPIFTDCPFEFRVSENELPFEPLMPPICGASDPDDLDPLLYSISGNEITGIVLVNIDPSTGRLFAVNNINREIIGTQFTVTLTIADSALSTSRNVTIVIIGQNEFPPAFSSASYMGEVIENEIRPASVVNVVATDEDERPDIEADPLFVTRITYSLRIVTPANATGYFTINNMTGEIFQLEAINYEEISEFVLEVIADDNDPTSTAMSSTVLVIITVRNVNDEPPFFITFQDFIVVSELNPPRSSFFTFTFGDPDSDSLQLQFAPPAPSEFLLLSTSGELSNFVQLDADQEPREYNYTIILTDLNTPPELVDTIGSISTNITIAVQDSNDNVPQFNENIYRASIVENSPNGSIIVIVGATDADYGFDAVGMPNGNNELTYFLVDAPVDTFAINPITGEITILRVLDREEQSEYEFLVGVQDNPTVGGSLVDTALVRVTVMDVNEHSPQVDPPNYFVFVPEDTLPNTELQTFVSVSWNYERK